MKPGTIQILTRLRFHQFFRQKNKGLVGKVIIVAYFWFLELLLFFMLRKEGITDFPPLLVAGICLGFIVPDFLFKLLFEHDQTVMDAFIRTRPISQSGWDRFLSVSQFWKASNLAMPIILAPACFMFMSIGWGLAVLLVLYLFSVFGGFLVMLLKHKGPYVSEKAVAISSCSLINKNQHLVFGLQLTGLVRSRRLRTMILGISFILLLEYIFQIWAGAVELSHFFLLGFIVLPVAIFVQYGLGIEAGFFGGIWSKPLPVLQLLYDKFRMTGLLGGIAALISIPICLLFHQPVTTPLAYAVFSTGFGGIILLIDAYNRVPFDLFGKTFFNYQGTDSVLRTSSFFGTLLVMIIGVGLPFFLPGWLSDLILASLGIAGIAIHRPYFRWVERKFLNSRYKYIEKYLSK